MNKFYTLIDTRTGEITCTMEIADKTVPTTTEANKAMVEVSEAFANGFESWIDTRTPGEFTKIAASEKGIDLDYDFHPDTPAVLSAAEVAIGDPLTVSRLVIGTTVKVSGVGMWTVTDGELQITFDRPADYHIVCRAPGRYSPVLLKVVVHDRPAE
jgi:hypothetical protein